MLAFTHVDFQVELGHRAVVAGGCNAEQSPSKIETGVPRGSADQIKVWQRSEATGDRQADSPPAASKEPGETKPKPAVE